MKSIKVLLAICSLCFISSVGYASGSSPNKKAIVEDPQSIVIDAAFQFDAPAMVYVSVDALIYAPEYVYTSRTTTGFKAKIPLSIDQAAILIDYGSEFKSEYPLVRNKIGTPDTKRYFKYLFERQKVC